MVQFLPWLFLVVIVVCVILRVIEIKDDFEKR